MTIGNVDVQALLTAIVLGGAAFGSVWKWVFVPIHKAAKTIDKAAEAGPTLFEIAAHFEPNHGTSLRDVIDRIERRQSEQEDRFITQGHQLTEHGQQLQVIENKIDAFLTNRQPGGQRSTDAT